MKNLFQHDGKETASDLSLDSSVAFNCYLTTHSRLYVIHNNINFQQRNNDSKGTLGHNFLPRQSEALDYDTFQGFQYAPTTDETHRASLLRAVGYFFPQKKKLVLIMP